MNLADLPVPGQAGLSAVVAALLKRTTEQLDHPGPLRGNVSLFPFLLQVTPEPEIIYSCNRMMSTFAFHMQRRTMHAHVCCCTKHPQLQGHPELCVVE